MNEPLPKKQVPIWQPNCNHKKVAFPTEHQSSWHVPCPWCLTEALREIAKGEGYYGAQAREYKQIAIAALRNTGAGV